MYWYEPGEAEKVERELQAKRYQIEELEEELAEQRITAATNDRTITVVVDGNGRVVDLSITTEALRSHHRELIGSRIVSVVQQARLQAVQAGSETVKARFG